MRKNKWKFLFAALSLVLILTTLVSCSNNDGNFELIDSKYAYNEAEFVADMAKTKAENVAFAQDGHLMFDYIVYPSIIDDLSYTESGGIKRMDRHKIELKNTIKFFADALHKITDDEINIIADNAYSTGAAIMLKVDENLAAETKNQGYKLDIATGKITISSDTLQGITNGIYSFLENNLGCMFVSEDFDYIPKMQTINLSKGTTVDTPDIQWRYVYGYEAERHQKDNIDVDYLDWHSKLKLNGAGMDDWFNWCHTSFVYISPEEYFEEHPEYFSLYNGKRCHTQGPVSGQLCWTNEEVYQIISEKVLQEMAENPDLHLWDVSQMDTWINRGVGCQCKNCKAIDKKEGSPMGSILTFVNRLAKEVKEKFPNNYISTLSYNYSVKPPKNIKPEDNVIIKLCLMPGDCASGLKNPKNKVARQDKEVIEAWSKIADNILIWDYDVNFHHYLLPHPALAYVEENHKFYLENNTYGIFHQMAHTKGGADAELSSYVYAKSMWDSDVDCSKLIAKYMQVYYGSAANTMTTYYNTLYNDVLKSGKKMYIYDSPTLVSMKYFSHAKVDNYIDILNKAISEVEGDKFLTDKINKVKIAPLYLRATTFGGNVKERTNALDELKAICDQQGIKEFREWSPNDVETLYEQTKKDITASVCIIVACVLGGLILIAGIILLVLWLKKRKRKKLAASANEIAAEDVSSATEPSETQKQNCE